MQFSDCSQASVPGFYQLKSLSADYDIPNVQCLDDNYLVIQSRGQLGNSQDYFFRGWEEYANGFGEAGKSLSARCVTVL